MRENVFWALAATLAPKASPISCVYERLRPGFGDMDSPPSELSVGLTTWNWSGCRARSLVPRLPGPLKVRPAQETSVGLFGGPTACDASEPLRTALPTAPCRLSVRPKGSLPLNVLLARPSLKLSRLKAAATIGGVFRPVTRRL